MGLRARILKSVSGVCGNASKAVLRGQARDERQRTAFPEVLRELLASGELVMYGDKRGAVYGLPRKKRA